MRRNNRFAFVLILGLSSIALLSSGCGNKTEQEEETPAKLVKTVVIGSAATGGIRNFPARVDADQRVNLSFRVDGTLYKLRVRESDQVKKNQVVAELDPADFKTVVRDRAATYERTSANFERGKKMVKNQYISEMEFDRVKAEYRSAQAALQQAKQNLTYTVLRAPFAGRVARRYVQNFESVKAKQEIIELQSTDIVEIKIDVPEALVLRLRQESDKRAGDKVKAYAIFSDKQDVQFPLTFKEASTRADAATKTFEVTFTMPTPKDVTILPGMTASVTIDLGGQLATNDIVELPASAVVGSTSLTPTVWVVDPKSMTVGPRSVKVGRMLGSRIQIISGVTNGERVVVAGAAYLSEGTKVRLMPAEEQAETPESASPVK
ncbi:MAG: efflux RND transporter periplasmic adaptor subunit [Acidiferrobacterales bacterium]|jgi:RND family efflux transporter MFP subunit|nr:efflux RND transporter periplasmic adaptor subunit [Acidiferrobacterales bacterium]